MIVVNGIRKSGTTWITQYLASCGLYPEPGGLGAMPGRPLRVLDGVPGQQVRSLHEILSDPRPRVIGAHVCYGAHLLGHQMVLVARHPRDILVSWARWNEVNLDWTHASEPDTVAVRRRMNREAMDDLVGQLDAYKGWLNNGRVLVRFEGMQHDPVLETRALCSQLGVEWSDPDDVWGDRAPWVTRSYRGTWSGRHSAWQEYWDEAADKTWRAAGGKIAEADWGY